MERRWATDNSLCQLRNHITPIKITIQSPQLTLNLKKNSQEKGTCFYYQIPDMTFSLYVQSEPLISGPIKPILEIGYTFYYKIKNMKPTTPPNMVLQRNSSCNENYPAHIMSKKQNLKGQANKVVGNVISQAIQQTIQNIENNSNLKSEN